MHNIVNGEIIIKLDSSTLSIINSGQKLNITGDIFKRFIRSENKDSLCIGLSIVKKICGYYSIPISYNFNKTETNEYIDKFNHEYTNVKINVASDNSVTLVQRTELLVKNGIIGILLVLLFLSFTSFTSTETDVVPPLLLGFVNVPALEKARVSAPPLVLP